MRKTAKDLLKMIQGQGNQVDLGGVLQILIGSVASTQDLGNFEEFNEDVSYSVGAVVLYDGLLYRFTKNHIGEWNEEDVVQTNVTEMMGAMPIEYMALKKLRNENKLVAGAKYRITDYECSTEQADTQAQAHHFDIIVTALSENVLSEEAQAIEHDGEDYFKTQHLNAWKLWYCLDNDFERFRWAKEDVIELAVNGVYQRFPQYDEDGHWAWAIVGDKEIYTDDVVYTDPHPVVGGALYSGTHSSQDFSTDRLIAVLSGGTGIIYRMIDEWGNDLPYDFKNMQFKRMLTDGYLDNEDGEETWVYTFNWYDENGDCHDASVIGNDGTLLNDENQIDGVYGNIMKPYMDYEDYDSPKSTKQYLNDNVFLSCFDYDGGNFYGYYSNTFGNGCSSNTFGNDCSSNTFGNDCSSNTFGNGCSSNTFGNGCSSNTFGNGCYSNTFGNECYSNTFGNGCYSNTFGNGCSSNTFGNGCYSNTFGNGCSSNTFGNECYSNTFGNECYSNTFGNGCYSNTFGNECYSNTFGNGCYSNTFGNECYSNTFGNQVGSNVTKGYISSLTLFEGVRYISIIGGSSSQKVQNAQVLNGTQGAGTSNRLTIAFQAGKSYTQIAGMTTAGQLKIWNPADLV